ncbi:MAG: ABC transporter substrate-binding protein [Rhodomicrobiaceae bacterium]
MRAFKRRAPPPDVTEYSATHRVCGWRSAILACLVALVPLAAVAAAKSDRVRISASQTAILVWIAEERGFFRDEGLDVDVELFQSGLSAVRALLGGKAQLSTTADATFVGQSFERPDLRFLATISTLETTRLVGRKDHGVENAVDLAGKRIGVTLSSASEYFLTRYLTLHGISADAPVLIDLTPSEIAEKLVRGDIDAGFTWEPFIGNAEHQLKSNAVTLPGQLDQLYYFMLLSTEPWLKKNPDKAERILRALIAAETFAIDEASAAKAIIQKRFGYRTADLDRVWHLHNLNVNLPQEMLFALEQQAAWQIQKELTQSKTAPNFLSMAATEPLSKVRPASLGIVK